MLKHLMVLPDGTEISSGKTGTALLSVKLTWCVNTEQELMPGAACAAMAEITILSPEPISLSAGDSFTLYMVDHRGQRQKAGIFLAEQPIRKGNLLQLTAYDRMILSDKDLTAWFSALQGWPFTLQELAQLVCIRCGLTLAEDALSECTLRVNRFAPTQVTGRQLLQWIAQAAGCFCRVDPEGTVNFQWYTPGNIRLGPVPVNAITASYSPFTLSLTLPNAEPSFANGCLSLESSDISTEMKDADLQLTGHLLQQYCLQGGTTLENFITAPIEKVQLQQTAEDIGTVYPNIPEEVNCFRITGNPLLCAENAESLVSTARALYEKLHPITYTPCTLQLPTTPQLQVGQMLTLWDTAGVRHNILIMKLVRSASGDTVTCTGSALRESSSAVNHSGQQSLAGKILNLRTDVDGIRAENADQAGKLSRIELDIDGIRGQVSTQSANADGMEQRLTRMEQSAESIYLAVEKIQTDGTTKLKTGMGYTFDDRGLQIARQGQQMKNLLDNTGMYVTRQGQTVLQANDKGVLATDVTVNNYLIVGDHARFEDYGQGRTACFYLEG